MINLVENRTFAPRPAILGAALAVSLAGCAQMGPASEPGDMPTPRFALPCQGERECTQLASCATREVSSCADFRGMRGLRQVHSALIGALDFRAQAVDTAKGAPVSLWHEVPLVVSDTDEVLVVNAFFEISRGTQGKMELNKWERHNPIWQDRRSVSGQNFDRPRYYAWSPAPGNYGALPRTWENVLEPDPLTGFPGDSDPIDVIDVGSAGAPLGIVAQVKVIGALGMIDGTDRQTDWKIYVINTADPMATTVDDISDVPQRIKDEWALFWRFYKTPGGNSENFFYAPESASGFSENAVWLSAEQAREIVSNSAASYRKLVDNCLNLRVAEPYWVPNCPS
jgi:inorganic pyrophosphatase